MQQPTHGYKPQPINQALPNKTYVFCAKPYPLSPSPAHCYKPHPLNIKPHPLPALSTPSLPIISPCLCNTPYYYYKSHLINQACPERNKPHPLSVKPPTTIHPPTVGVTC